MWAMMCDLWCSNSVEREQSAEGVEATQRDVHPFRKCLQGAGAKEIPKATAIGHQVVLPLRLRCWRKEVTNARVLANWPSGGSVLQQRSAKRPDRWPIWPSGRFVPEQRSVENTCIIFIIFRAIEKSVICNLKLS
ncbi:hypothetical protein CEXT_79651 [Caerostris extrusa]|uniref:Uncharacterized protein n=1 Tax=Caerostris extrusa TaxID=172846 RepID=A0AAV4UWL5_CAEEX|nr:hypothetical protein CEXT_79651 [Caerostris extrusa]